MKYEPEAYSIRVSLSLPSFFNPERLEYSEYKGGTLVTNNKMENAFWKEFEHCSAGIRLITVCDNHQRWAEFELNIDYDRSMPYRVQVEHLKELMKRFFKRYKEAREEG